MENDALQHVLQHHFLLWSCLLWSVFCRSYHKIPIGNYTPKAQYFQHSIYQVTACESFLSLITPSSCTKVSTKVSTSCTCTYFFLGKGVQAMKKNDILKIFISCLFIYILPPSRATKSILFKTLIKSSRFSNFPREPLKRPTCFETSWTEDDGGECYSTWHHPYFLKKCFHWSECNFPFKKCGLLQDSKLYVLLMSKRAPMCSF